MDFLREFFDDFNNLGYESPNKQVRLGKDQVCIKEIEMLVVSEWEESGCGIAWAVGVVRWCVH